MAIAIIGDVHGCLDELDDLVQKIRNQENIEEIIFVGDLMDKGPDSVGVLKYIRELEKETKETKVTIVEGNHESRNFRFWRYLEKGYTDQAMSMRDSEELLGIMEKSEKDLRCWIQEKVVPYAKRPEIGIAVVHGGITPKIKELPDDHARLTGKNRKRVRSSSHVRYVTDTGSRVKLGEESIWTPFWADVYDGRFGHIYFGHQTWRGKRPRKFPHATGVDLGCVCGGHLCAAIVDRSGTRIQAIQAKEKYWELPPSQ